MAAGVLAEIGWTGRRSGAVQAFVRAQPRGGDMNRSRQHYWRRLLEVTALAASAIFSAGCGGQGSGVSSGGGSFSSNLYTSIALADFNGDGNLDIATCYTIVSNGSNGHQGTVQVFLQDPAHPGKLLAPASYSVGNDPFTIAVGDLNGDGKPDIVTANASLGKTNPNGLSVLLQNGNGQFLPATNYSTGNVVNSVAIGDVNRDGRADLIVADSSGVSILLQNSASPGNFTAAGTVSITGGASSVAVSDVNGDGVPDLVAANGADVFVFLGNASAPGTFLPAVTYRTGQQPIFVAVADLNGDGKPDIAVADEGLPATTTGVHVLLQDPSSPGTFQAPMDYVTGSGSTELAIAEIDGDGTPDVAAASGANVSVLFGSTASPGNFPTINNYPGNPGQTGFRTIPPMVLWVAIGDLNGDGRPDLVFADDTGVSIRFQDPANPGKFLSSTTVVSSP
jgi:hypothetical protein